MCAVHGSTVCTPCALPCLPALALAPVTITALSRSSCRFAQVIPRPCSCLVFVGWVLPSWREMTLWLLALVLPPSLGSALARHQCAGKGVAGTHLDGFVDFCHVDTRVQSIAPCAIMACDKGMGHKRESPGNERGSMAAGLCPSTHSTLAVPLGICVGLGCRRAAPGQCPLCPVG